MQISLRTAEGNCFIFSLLPEKLNVKYAAKYQSFDIISEGTIDIPKGSDVVEISWSSEFFGKSKKNLAGVDTANWKEPDACIQTLRNWLNVGTELTLIVSGTWINVDVTIASFDTTPHGGYGDVSYSITFKKVRTLKIYTAKELKIGKKKKTKSRTKKKSSMKKKYVLKKGDTLNKVSLKTKIKWIVIYKKLEIFFKKWLKSSVLGTSRKKRARFYYYFTTFALINGLPDIMSGSLFFCSFSSCEINNRVHIKKGVQAYG